MKIQTIHMASNILVHVWRHFHNIYWGFCTIHCINESGLFWCSRGCQMRWMRKCSPLQCSRRVAANIQPVTKKSTRSLHKQSYTILTELQTMNTSIILRLTTLCYYSIWQIRNEKHMKIFKESIIYPNVQLDRSFFCDKVGWYLAFMCCCYHHNVMLHNCCIIPWRKLGWGIPTQVPVLPRRSARCLDWILRWGDPISDNGE